MLFVATEENHTENTEMGFVSVFSVRLLQWLGLHSAGSNIGIEVELLRTLQEAVAGEHDGVLHFVEERHL